MSYKTILVHVDASSRADARIRIAAAIATAQDAHLIGTAVTGISHYLAQTRMLADLDPHLRTQIDVLRQRALRSLADFRTAAQKSGLASFEQRLVDDEAGDGICLQARYADLVVIGQSAPDQMSPLTPPDFPQYVVLHSGRPVLLVPHSGRFDTIGRRVLIAWNESMEATRSLAGALPVLQCAGTADAVIFNRRVASRRAGAQAGADLAAYLARHGIRINLLQHHASDAGQALLALVRELGSDLLVMGGYGHHRFREILLGGVTSSVLEGMSIPVLMSH